MSLTFLYGVMDKDRKLDGDETKGIISRDFFFRNMIQLSSLLEKQKRVFEERS